MLFSLFIRLHSVSACNSHQVAKVFLSTLKSVPSTGWEIKWPLWSVLRFFFWGNLFGWLVWGIFKCKMKVIRWSTFISTFHQTYSLAINCYSKKYLLRLVGDWFLIVLQPQQESALGAYSCTGASTRGRRLGRFWLIVLVNP